MWEPQAVTFWQLESNQWKNNFLQQGQAVASFENSTIQIDF